MVAPEIGERWLSQRRDVRRRNVPAIFRFYSILFRKYEAVLLGCMLVTYSPKISPRAVLRYVRFARQSQACTLSRPTFCGRITFWSFGSPSVGLVVIVSMDVVVCLALDVLFLHLFVCYISILMYSNNKRRLRL